MATLQNARTDDYNEDVVRDQESPAVYTNGILHRLVSYSGPSPFQDDTLTYYDASFDKTLPFPWIPGRFSATEHWAAFVDDKDWGVGVINVVEDVFLGGFYFPERKRCGYSKNVQTGYIAPVSQHALPRNITFTYEFYLVVGSVDYIRSFANEVRTSHLGDNNTRRLQQKKEHGVPSDPNESHETLRHPGLSRRQA